MKLDIRIVPQLGSREEMDELVDIDRVNFKSEPLDIAFEWANRFPWMYTLVKRNTEKGPAIMGYGLVIPADRFVLEGLRRGEIGEEDLTSKHIRLPSDAECFYIASMGTRPGITTYESSRLVGNSTGPVLRSTVPVVTVAITHSGEKVAREIGLVPKENSQNAFQGVDGYVPMLLEKGPFEFGEMK